MINLLLVSPQTKQSQGGMTVWTDTFLAHCSENDISCELVNTATIGSRAKKGNSRRNFFDEFVRTKSIFRVLKTKLNEKEYHVAHVNTSCGAFGLIRDLLTVRKIKKKQPQIKRVVHFHCDAEKQTAAKYKLYFLKKLLALTDHALVLNEPNKNFIKKISSVKVDTIANFVDESWIRNQEKLISDRIEKVVFVGFVQPEKGMREIYALAERYPKITFDVVGQVREDVKMWTKPENIVLHGAKGRSEVVSMLDSADAFIFPTHGEGFSIALLESMSRGLPCITTTVGANAEMIENKGGFVVSVGDVEAMASAFDAMQNPAMRRNMSAWNIEKVRSCYTVEAVFNELKKFYK